MVAPVLDAPSISNLDRGEDELNNGAVDTLVSSELQDRNAGLPNVGLPNVLARATSSLSSAATTSTLGSPIDTPTVQGLGDDAKILPAPFVRLLPRSIQMRDAARPETSPSLIAGAQPEAFKLPAKRRSRNRSNFWLVVFFFLVPALTGSFYYGYWATNQYVSEFRFNVVDTSSSSSALTSGLSSILGGSGLGTGVSNNYTVVDYIGSEQAMLDVGAKVRLRDIFTYREADYLARLRDNANNEQLLSYWQRMVSADYDPITGIATARVRAFDATTSQLLSKTLLASAEKLVNNMQTRRYDDSVKFAQIELDRAEAKLTGLRTQMLKLRDTSNVVDPNSSTVAENIQLISAIRLQMASDQATLASARLAAPASPQIKALQDRIKGYQGQLDKLDKEVNSKSTSKQLSKTVGLFEDLTAKQALALAEVTGDLTNLIQARATADAQHIYLLSYVLPTFPTSSNYPNRPLAILLVLIASVGSFVIAKVLFLLLKSHSV